MGGDEHLPILPRTARCVGELNMLDLTGIGELVLHRSFTSEGNDVMELMPFGTTRAEKDRNLRQILQRIDGFLPTRGRHRSILIQKAENFPCPCVIVMKD